MAGGYFLSGKTAEYEISNHSAMSLFLDILTIVLPVFLVVGIGFLIKRISLIDTNFLFQLNRLVYYLALPSLLFYKIATADFSLRFNGNQVAGVGLTVLLGFSLSYFYGVFRKYGPQLRGTFAQGAFRGNLAYVGLAIVFNAYGEEGLANASILLGFIVPILNLLAVVGLLLPHQHKDATWNPGLLLRQIVLNPLILASFFGVFWSFFQFPVPQVVDRALHIVTDMALPLALISIGASFSFTKMRGDITIAIIASCIKLVFMPMLAASILIFLGVRGQELAIGVLFAGTPTATAAYIMAEQMGGDAELSASIIMLTTLFSIVTFTVTLYLLRSFGI